MWNPNATYGAEQFIRSASPSCSGVLNMVSAITCSFSSDTKLLTVTNMINADVSGGVELIFDVDNFANPYSGISRTGFYINTMDSNDPPGSVDTTLNNIVLTVQVSDWATMTSGTFSKDGSDIVEELAEGNVFFSISNIPVDPSCRLKITFPGD